MNTHTHTCTHARTHTHTHTRARARAHARTHARTHTRTPVRTWTNGCTHARAHINTHTHTHTHIHTHIYAHAHAHTRTHTRARALTQTLQEREREGNEVYCVCILGYSKWRNWRAICITGWTWWKRKWKVSGVSIYFNSLSLYNAKCCLFVFSMMYLWVIFILYFMPISNPVSRFVILCVCFCALYFTHARKEQRETSIICIQFRTRRNDQ